MTKTEEVTWKDIYENFKAMYPNLKRYAIFYIPFDYMTIEVYCKDGRHFLYNDNSKIAWILQNEEAPYDKIAKDAEAYWKQKKETNHWSIAETRRHMYGEGEGESQLKDLVDFL